MKELTDEQLYKRVSAHIYRWLVGCNGGSYHNLTRLAHFGKHRQYGEWRIYRIIERIVHDAPHIYDISPDGLSVRINRSHPCIIASNLVDEYSMQII